MTPVRKFRVRSRLSALAFKPGGVTVNEALKQAGAAVEPLRESSLEMIDAWLAEIEAKFGPGVPTRDGEAFEDLYLLCANIIDLSLFLPESGLGEAARASCDLVDQCAVAARWDWIAIDVHVHALKLLRAIGSHMPGDGRRALLDGLTQVRRRRCQAGDGI